MSLLFFATICWSRALQRTNKNTAPARLIRAAEGTKGLFACAYDTIIPAWLAENNTALRGVLGARVLPKSGAACGSSPHKQANSDAFRSPERISYTEVASRSRGPPPSSEARRSRKPSTENEVERHIEKRRKKKKKNRATPGRGGESEPWEIENRTLFTISIPSTSLPRMRELRSPRSRWTGRLSCKPA